MNFLKALFSWKLWLNILIGLAILIGLWFFTFNWLNDYTEHNVEVKVPDLSKMSIGSAMRELDTLGLEYSVDSTKFLENAKPFAVLEYYPEAGAFVKPGRKIFIKSNPRTWQPIELPNLIDKSSRLAFIQLSMRHFKVGDTIFVKDPAKGAVLKVLYQGKEVAAGTFLPRGSKIDLVLGKGYDLDVSVPNLMGMSLEEAEQTIKDNFFQLGNINFLGNNNDTIAATVVYQDPPPADVYDQGLPINIWLSTKMTSELKNQIDSLDILFRRKIKRDSSFYKQSINKSLSPNISESMKESIEQSEAVNRIREEKQRKKNKVDTTGISID